MGDMPNPKLISKAVLTFSLLRSSVSKVPAILGTMFSFLLRRKGTKKRRETHQVMAPKLSWKCAPHDHLGLVEIGETDQEVRATSNTQQQKTRRWSGSPTQHRESSLGAPRIERKRHQSSSATSTWTDSFLSLLSHQRKQAMKQKYQRPKNWWELLSKSNVTELIQTEAITAMIRMF